MDDASVAGRSPADGVAGAFAGAFGDGAAGEEGATGARRRRSGSMVSSDDRARRRDTTRATLPPWRNGPRASGYSGSATHLLARRPARRPPSGAVVDRVVSSLIPL